MFTGNTSEPEQLLKVVNFAEELEGVLQLYAGDVAKAFDILSFSMVTKEKVLYNTIPSFLRSHWTKWVYFSGVWFFSALDRWCKFRRAFIDDIDAVGKHGSGGYKYYGIDEKEGAIIVVRPDGYVGAVTPLNKVSDLKVYFNYFMSKRMLSQTVPLNGI